MLKSIQQFITFLLVLNSSIDQILAFSPSDSLRNEVGYRDERCPMINPKVAKLLPNEMDCTTYFICESGLAILRECPDDLHFNAKKLVCDFPDRAGCEIEESYRKVRSPVGFPHPDCPAKNPKNPVLLPSPTECGKFYICDGGLAYEKNCHPGLHFNTKLKVCDFPSNVNCDGSDSSTAEDDDDNRFDCPKTNSPNPVYLPHPSDCEKFYMCDKGQAHLKECKTGLHFNPKLKVCDFPEGAQCAIGDSSTAEDDDDNHFDCPKTKSPNPVYLPHPSDCEKFYMCDKGQAHLKECKTGLHFNPKLKVCDFPEGTQCSIVKSKSGKEGDKTGFPSPFCPTVNGKFPIFFPHPTNCSIYYMCGNGLAYEFGCPAGLHFSVKKEVCDNPIRAKCLVLE